MFSLRNRSRELEVVFRIDRFYARLPLIEKKEVKQRPVGSF
jgi:hypothetical protein